MEKVQQAFPFEGKGAKRLAAAHAEPVPLARLHPLYLHVFLREPHKEVFQV
ncbi:MAG: hypothetical protein KatS3mg033_1099 [Thermonema sp.]|nr:MAG: hypothetical protein KatS3mg033_1099 [Thermonema sp.]